MTSASASASSAGSATPPTPGGRTDVAFQDALQVATGIAARSPSSHNCQPWGVGWATDAATRRTAAALLATAAPGERAGDGPGLPRRSEYLVLALDRARRLTALPAHEVEMLLSCGAYGEILARALAAQGWRADGIRFLGREDTGDGGLFGDRWPRAWRPLCVVRLSPAPADPDGLAALRDTVRARHTNRGPYRAEAIDPAVLARLSSPGPEPSLFRTHPHVTVHHLVTDAERAAVAGLVARYGGRDFAHLAAWRETHAYIRRDEADAERGGDGFTLGQLFGAMSPPRRWGMRAALAPATMRLLRHVGYDRFLARQLAAAVRGAPAIVALCFERCDGPGDSGGPDGPGGSGGPGDRVPDAGSGLRAGAALAGYWLGATRAGLALHPVSIVLQHDDVRAAFERRLGLPGRAFFVSRLGHAVAAFPPSHRLAPSRALRHV